VGQASEDGLAMAKSWLIIIVIIICAFVCDYCAVFG
jgi:hypothetical protein